MFARPFQTLHRPSILINIILILCSLRIPKFHLNVFVWVIKIDSNDFSHSFRRKCFWLQTISRQIFPPNIHHIGNEKREKKTHRFNNTSPDSAMELANHRMRTWNDKKYEIQQMNKHKRFYYIIASERARAPSNTCMIRLRAIKLFCSIVVFGKEESEIRSQCVFALERCVYFWRHVTKAFQRA